MKITFDPNNPEDVKAVQGFLSGGVTNTVVNNTMVQETPQSEPQANIQANPENRVDPNNPEDGGEDEVDSLGMKWDGSIHAATKTKKADGTWKVAKGKVEEHAAAIAAHKAAQSGGTTEQPEETLAPAAPMGGMPGAPMPAPSPELPAPVITYEQVSTRFVGMMESGKITDYAAVYSAAGVTNPADLNTNESLRAALWAEMDKIDNA